MRILVLSDSHGDSLSCKLAIEKHPTAEIIIHLGDGEDDIDSLEAAKTKHILCVRGNMSRISANAAPLFISQKICGYNFYCAHGFIENVKFGIDNFIERACEENADIALYGHTHTQFKGYEQDIHILNPGSIRQGDYAVIDITEAGIVTLLMKLF